MRPSRTRLFLLAFVLSLVGGLVSQAFAGTLGTYSFTVSNLSNPNFQLPAGTITFVQPTSTSPLQVTISLNSGFNFRNNGNAAIAFNAPAGSTVTLPGGSAFKLTSKSSLNISSIGRFTHGLTLKGNHNNPVITTLTFTITNPDGISWSSFVADDMKGTSVYFTAHVFGPLTIGTVTPRLRLTSFSTVSTTNTGWVGATLNTPTLVPEPSPPVLLAAGFLLAGLLKRFLGPVEV